MKKKLLLALPLIALLAGCTDLEDEYSSYTGDIKSVTISLPEINPEVASTRTNISIGSNVKVTWAENDTVGIFPVGGGQVEFPISSAAGTDHASFNGGKWALRGSEKYAAYFPYNKANIYRDSENILLDYTGQKQEGVNSTAHLGSYDFMGSPAVTADKNGNLDFELKRFAKIMILRLTFPEPLQVTSVRMQAEEPVFISKQILNISGDVPYVDTAEEGLTNEVQLETELQEPVQSGDFYLMMAMQDLTPYNLRVLVTTADKRFFSSDIVSKNMTDEKNYAYLAAAELEESNDYIVFEDPTVERICLEHWDTNNDGGLSYAEAAAVEDLGNAFRNAKIDRFDEFQYFTGLESVGGFFDHDLGLDGVGGFYNSSVVKITLPNSITYIDERAFENCHELRTVIIPEGVTMIKADAFAKCSWLPNITLPSTLTTIEQGAFSECSNLADIVIPDGVTEIGAGAFIGCNFTNITLPSNLIKIASSVFALCSNLTDVIIPDGVTEIGADAFMSCNNLTSITINSTTPPTLGDSALVTGNSCPIYVPRDYVAIYKSAWPDYADRIFEIGASGGFGGEGGID